jgi:hypothetical protein
MGDREVWRGMERLSLHRGQIAFKVGESLWKNR